MWQFVVLLLIQSTVLGSNQIAPDFSYYHKTDEINNELKEFSQSCDGMVTLVLLEDKPEIYAVDIENKQVDSDSLQKSLFIFGEHARELISAETGLHLLRQLCGKEQNSNIDISQILQKNKFRLVLNSNPESRKLVESGKYCQRTNENGVDLNRNWDAHWSNEKTNSENNPGPSPFSEPETIALKTAFEDYKPEMFLTIHSGTLGMYIPYAYFPQEADDNAQNMRDVLEELNPKYCNCESGSAAVALQMPCRGTCLDYAYEHKALYSFAFEIYSQYEFAPGWTQEYSSFISMNQHKKRLRGKSSQKHTSSCFFQTSSKYTMKNEECFSYFNPTSKDEYDFVINNWTTAILELVQLVNQKVADS